MSTQWYYTYMYLMYTPCVMADPLYTALWRNNNFVHCIEQLEWSEKGMLGNLVISAFSNRCGTVCTQSLALVNSWKLTPLSSLYTWYKHMFPFDLGVIYHCLVSWKIVRLDGSQRIVDNVSKYMEYYIILQEKYVPQNFCMIGENWVKYGKYVFYLI